MACYYYAHIYNAKAYGFSLWRIDLLLRECENLLLSQQIISPTQEVDTRGVSTLTEFPNAVGDTPKQCTLLILKDTLRSGYCEIVRCGFEITHLVAKPVCFRIKCVCFC